MDVIVLGCGPSGLVAAHAAQQAGHHVLVMSEARRQSELWGCQYLHAPIPGITTLDSRVDVVYQLQGTPEGYLDKVYGDDYDGHIKPGLTSPATMLNSHPAWDLRFTYGRLWSQWCESVIPIGPLNGNIAADVLPDLVNGALVLNTIPRPALCRSPKHMFASADVWAMGDAPHQRIPVEPPADNMVVCNGNPDTGWYRVSRVFGYGTVEWPWRDGRRPPFEGISRLKKPVHTDCTCNPGVHHVGRYGAWQKGVLVHHVYEQVQRLLGQGVQGELF
jgi:hypothetical protein